MHKFAEATTGGLRSLVALSSLLCLAGVLAPACADVDPAEDVSESDAEVSDFENAEVSDFENMDASADLGLKEQQLASFASRPGWARDVALNQANPSVHWIIGNNPVPGGYSIHAWTPSGYVTVPGGAVRITIGPDGPWVVNSVGSIFMRTESAGNPAIDWIPMPGCATDIGGHPQTSVWIAGCDQVPEGGGYGIYRWSPEHAQWVREPAPAAAVRIAVGTRDKVIVNAGGFIYRKVNAGPWYPVPGNGIAQDVAVGDLYANDVFVVGMPDASGDGQIFKHVNGQWSLWSAQRAKNIAVAFSHKVVVSRSNFSIFATTPW